MHHSGLNRACPTLVMTLVLALTTISARAQDGAIPRSQLVTPGELSQVIKGSNGAKPLLFQVGSHTLYVQAHIPGSEYLGGAASDQGRQQLRQRVKAVPRNQAIVIYCGCCPWDRCPNVKPAFEELRSLGFSNVKVLYIADNFGADWVDKGYPVAKGE